MFFTVFGIISPIIYMLSAIPYLVDTVKGRIQPQRVTRGIIVLLNAVGFANQLASGARNSLWVFAASILVNLIIFIAALYHGVGGNNKDDMYIVAICLIGIAFWILLKNPLYSIIASMLVSLIALIPTFIKTKEYPKSENGIIWIGGFLSASAATIAVGKGDWQLLLLPAWSALLQLYAVYLIYFKNYETVSLAE